MILHVYFSYKKKKKKERVKVGNDKYPFEACATGCHPLRQYCHWKACFPYEWVNKINKSNDENQMFAPTPLFGWVWDRECLISKTLYGPGICAQVELKKMKEK